MKPDHRPAVAAQRREKMRARLIEAAVTVIAAKGIEGAVIEDVIAEAGVARGTFYNHFTDIPALMVAARDALIDECLVLSLAAVADVTDPAEACARGLRVALAISAAHPMLAQFSARTGLNVLQRCNLMAALLPPILEQGMAQGRFGAVPVGLAIDLLAGVMVVGLQYQAGSVAFDETALIAAALRMLAVDGDEALRLAALPVALVQPPEGGLIARSRP
jgi:AcrR family transcriptional regulator